MATASPPACSLLLPTISSAPTYAIGRRAPSLPKVAAPAAIEIPEEYEDEIEAVNIALDVTQVCGLFPPFYFLCFLDCIKLVACINRIR
jgi:cysteine synthase A